MENPTASPASDIAALEQRKKEILANEQDWLREDRAAQIDKELPALKMVGRDSVEPS